MYKFILIFIKNKEGTFNNIGIILKYFFLNKNTLMGAHRFVCQLWYGRTEFHVDFAPHSS